MLGFSDGIPPIRIEFEVDTSGLRRLDGEVRDSIGTIKRQFTSLDVKPDINYDDMVRDARVAGDRAADAINRELGGVRTNLSTTGGFGRKMTGGLGVLGVAAGTAMGAGLATAGIAAATVAATAIQDAFGEAVTQEQLLAKTNAVIKSTGGAAGVTAQQMLDLSGSIETLSGATQDELEVLNAQNVLATFTQIKNEVGEGNDVFNQATLAISNISTALGQDLQSSAVQVGKALNNPLKGVAALGRVGVQFTDEQKEQIATLVKNGKTMEAQKVILAELTTQFGGATEAIGNTTTGRIGRAVDSIKDALRGIAAAVLPTLGRIADWFTATLMPVLTDVGNAVGKYLGPVFSSLGGIFSGAAGKADGLGSSLGDVSGLVKDAKGIFDAIVPTLQTFGDMYKRYLTPVIETMVNTVIPNLIEGWKGFVGAILGVIKPALDKLAQTVEDNRPQLEKFADFLGKVASTILTVWSTIEKYLLPVLGFLVGVVFATLIGTIGILIETISGLVDFFEAAPGVISGAWDGITGFFQDIADGITGALSAVSDFLGGVINAVATFTGRLFAAAGFLWSRLTAPLAPVFTAVTGFFTNLWNAITQQLVAVGGFFADVWARFSEPVSAAVETIVGLFQGLWDRVYAGGEALIGVFTGVWERFQEPITNAVDAIWGFFTSLWEKITGFGSMLYDAATTAWGQFVQGVLDVLSSLPGKVGELLAQVPGINVALDALSGVGDAIGTSWDIVTGNADANGNPVTNNSTATTTVVNNYNVSAQGLTVSQVQQDAARRGALLAPAG